MQHNRKSRLSSLFDEAAAQAVDSTVTHRKQPGRTPGEPTALSGANAADEVSGLPKTSAFGGRRIATERVPTYVGRHKEEGETR